MTYVELTMYVRSITIIMIIIFENFTNNDVLFFSSLYISDRKRLKYNSLIAGGQHCCYFNATVGYLCAIVCECVYIVYTQCPFCK